MICSWRSFNVLVRLVLFASLKSASGFAHQTQGTQLPAYDSRYLHVGTSELVMRREKNADSQQLPWPEWRELFGTFGLINETGIDGIGLEPVVRDDQIPRMKATLIQIKLGALSMVATITPGLRFNITKFTTELKAMIGAACAGLKNLRKVWKGDPEIVELPLYRPIDRTCTDVMRAASAGLLEVIGTMHSSWPKMPDSRSRQSDSRCYRYYDAVPVILQIMDASALGRALLNRMVPELRPSTSLALAQPPPSSMAAWTASGAPYVTDII